MIEYPQWLMWPGELNEETCDRWLEICKKLPAQPASTFRTADAGDEENDGSRKTQIRWIYNDDATKEIHATLLHYLNTANETFKVNVERLPPIQFTEYADVGDHYDHHHDVDWFRQDGQHRKLSVIVQLSDPEDYEGGVFSFLHHQNPDAIDLRKRGTIMVFLPYIEHMVSPIQEGSRTSMVAWMEGPRWV